MDCAYHPGKEAVVACVNCGKLICIECKTELGGKAYCPPCANEIFVAKSTAEVAGAPAVVTKAPAGVRKVPTGATKGTGEVTREVSVTEEKISGAWWLMPIFLTWVGGLIAWAVNKDKDPKRARAMLFWGIGLSFLYLLLWFLGIWITALIVGGTIGLTFP